MAIIGGTFSLIGKSLSHLQFKIHFRDAKVENYILLDEDKHIISVHMILTRQSFIKNAPYFFSTDTLAIRDQTDEKIVHLFDAASGKPLNDGKPFQVMLLFQDLK